MINKLEYETIETYALATIGLVRGIGELILNEISDRFIIPRGLRQIDMPEFNKFLSGVAQEYLLDESHWVA